MAEKLFREKSLERISSPENLNEYLKVASPGVWLIMISVILVIVGGIFWASSGYVEKTVETALVSDGAGENYLIIKGNEKDNIAVDMEVRVPDRDSAKIVSVSATPIHPDENMSEYAYHLAGISGDEWIYVATVDGDYLEGTYPATIILGKTGLLTFITE